MARYKNILYQLQLQTNLYTWECLYKLYWARFCNIMSLNLQFNSNLLQINKKWFKPNWTTCIKSWTTNLINHQFTCINKSTYYNHQLHKCWKSHTYKILCNHFTHQWVPISQINMAPKYKLTYFDFSGLGEPIRFIFHYANIPFEDNRVSNEEWPKLKPSK